MSKLNEWKTQVKKNAISDKGTIKHSILSKTTQEDAFRLEILLNESRDEILIQGNMKGLSYLIESLERLINTNAIGGHIHLEDGHPLTKANVKAILQLVDENEKNDGSHQLDAP